MSTGNQLGKYQPYPEYKDSGVEWLGFIPEHWIISKTSRYFKIAMGQTILKEQLDETGKWPVYSATEGDSFFGYIDNPQVKLRCGDLVIPARGNSIGFVKLISGDATTTQTTIYCKHATRKVEAKFAFYYMHGNRKSLFWFTQTAIPQITVEEVGGNPLVLPPLREQRTIAAFLDYETARIDQLIAKQQQLIELLKEKRQAVISHAVTKGLNPDAPMKDSGVEWLGEVPEHWVVTRLKNTVELIDGDRSSHYPNENDLVDSGIPFLSSKNIIGYKLSDHNLRFITNEKFQSLGRGKLRDRDLVITVRGTIGHVGLFDSQHIGYESGFINAQMMIMRPKRINAQYLHFITESISWIKQLDASSYGSAQQQLSNEILSNVNLALPPSEEQSYITIQLNKIEDQFNNLVFSAQKQIGLLQERRTTLISAAVTGKIDLRGWQPPQSETQA